MSNRRKVDANGTTRSDHPPEIHAPAFAFLNCVLPFLVPPHLDTAGFIRRSTAAADFGGSLCTAPGPPGTLHAGRSSAIPPHGPALVLSQRTSWPSPVLGRRTNGEAAAHKTLVPLLKHSWQGEARPAFTPACWLPSWFPTGYPPETFAA